MNPHRSTPSHTKTRAGPKYPTNDPGRPHTDTASPRPAIASPRQPRPTASGPKRRPLPQGDCRRPSRRWLWMAENSSRYLEMALGGFRWLSAMLSFSNYGENHYFKFKRSRQLWKAFVVSSSNNFVVSPLQTNDQVFG